ncbi:MAG: rod shape-determining protein MreC [Clostridia bacterium]|nr:rod shape-determining protein MreC [Clostridia bacterium]
MDYRYDFTNNSEKNKKKIIFVVVFSILVIMFVAFFFRNSNNKIVSSIAGVISKPITLVYNAFTGISNSASDAFTDVDTIKQENDTLKAENESLRLQLLESQKILDENSTLKGMLNIQKEYQHFELVMGNIIYREHDNWTQTFTINVGKNEGIEINQPVVHEEGLVGYISNVTDTTAVVTTILDSSSSVSVNISTINEPAVVNGDLELKSNNRLKLTYIPLDTEIAVSDMLYTSGIGLMYPSSIPVGRIVEIVNNKNDVNRYALVEPCVNISKISEVAVIIN